MDEEALQSPLDFRRDDYFIRRDNARQDDFALRPGRRTKVKTDGHGHTDHNITRITSCVFIVNAGESLAGPVHSRQVLPSAGKGGDIQSQNPEKSRVFSLTRPTLRATS